MDAEKAHNNNTHLFGLYSFAVTLQRLSTANREKQARPTEPLMHTEVISAPAVTGILFQTALNAFRWEALENHALMLLLLSSLVQDATRKYEEAAVNKLRRSNCSLSCALCQEAGCATRASRVGFHAAGEPPESTAALSGLQYGFR
jgi:hypothetical protein